MANQDHLARLHSETGVAAWNNWRSQHPEQRPDLSSCDLIDADLAGIDLSSANLQAANLAGANLAGANLKRAVMNRTILTHASLQEADMSATWVYNADLSGSNLSSVKALAATLVKCDLSRAYVQDALLMKLNCGLCNFSGSTLMGANCAMAKIDRCDFRGAALNRTYLHSTHFTRCDMTGANLELAVAVNTKFTDSNLTDCRVFGIAAWNIDLDRAVQRDLIITQSEPYVRVDDLEVAQFIYLLLQHQKLRNVLSTVGEKAVLILGRFSERKELLDGMADRLRQLGFLPIIFDFERPTDRDLTETVKVLAGLSRFVIADITNPRSVPLELQATIPDYEVPFVTMLQQGQPEFGMFRDLPGKYPWALRLLRYDTIEALLKKFESAVVNPALEQSAQLRRRKAEPLAERSLEDLP
jgi:uncharacterized protein YjbI with pentapeptide repeats